MKKKTKDKNVQVLEQGDRISWSEGVKINIDDFESRDGHLSMSTNIRDGETPEGALKRARSFVQKRLYKFEKSVRKSVMENVDFDTMAKLRK